MHKRLLYLGACLAALVGIGSAGHMYADRIGDGLILAPKPSIKLVVEPKPKFKDLIGDPLPVHKRLVDRHLTPKEYGLRYGTGASRKHKSNRNRYACAASNRKRFNA
jgi:hypothetical protein